ncbi:MAG: LysR family transcriptional regulator [Kiloniellaceae bacterium]|nr:LysR family transcriptional regulator [Kiloniellaceae bacterium]
MRIANTMSRHLDSDLLRTFVAIADHGSFSRAGAAVGRSQSAVSLQMKRLEDTAGCSLFRRQSHGVALTASGEGLLVNARRILRLLDRAAGELSGQSVAGSVRLGMPASYGASILSAVLARFAAHCPDVEVTLDCAQGLALESALAAGELDLIVLASGRPGAQGEALVHDPAVWVTSAAHDTHLCDPLPVALFGPGCWWHDRALQILEDHRRRYRIACTSPNTEAVAAAVASGLAVAVLELSTVPEGTRILTEAEGFPGFPGSTVMLRRRPGVSSLAVDRMEEVIRAVFCRT